MSENLKNMCGASREVSDLLEDAFSSQSILSRDKVDWDLANDFARMLSRGGWKIADGVSTLLVPIATAIMHPDLTDEGRKNLLIAAHLFLDDLLVRGFRVPQEAAERALHKLTEGRS